MSTLHLLLNVVGFLLVIAAVPLALELLVLSAAAALPLPQRLSPAGADTLKLAVIVPAHNEQRLVGACVRSLMVARTSSMRVLVVAHNCTDATAERAAAAGADVLVLNERSGHGKGAALHHGFTHALAEGYEAMLVVDADSTVSALLPTQVANAMQARSHAVQCRYVAARGAASTRTRLMAVALLGMNVLRPKGRARLGLSCGIFGNGFALSADTLRRVPYVAHSVVEDLEYHLLLVRAGLRVDFLNEAEVRGEMPETNTGAATQRARWEGGRQRMRRTWAAPLLREALHGRVRLLEPLLDLLAVPLATGVLLLLTALVIARGWVQGVAAFGLAGVLLYVVVAASLGDDPWANGRALLSAPFYLAFKLTMIPRTRAAARSNAAWVRTQRNEDAE